jgi:carbon monoxide dehydrogenase subunit G
MVKKIGIGVLILIVAVIALIATRPGSFHVERSGQVDAPPEAVFSILNDFQHWHEWSPYDKRDPNLKSTVSEPSAGPGALYTWTGNDDVGEGRMTLVESKPGELVSMNLEFIRPFAATNQVSFKLTPAEGGTKVTWSLDGKNNFIAKAMSLLMDMDKMIGKDFEQGLVNLNSVAQAQSQQPNRDEKEPASADE